MNPNELTETEQQFLIELYKQTKGNVASKVSMFDIGAALGKDRTESSRTAEVLIGWELVEVKTLSGGIGITAAGNELIKQMGVSGTSELTKSFKLGNAPMLNPTDRQQIESILAELKNETPSLKLVFDSLSEWMADIKTIEAQLTSPKPKSSIIRECFRSMKDAIKNSGNSKVLTIIQSVLNE